MKHINQIPEYNTNLVHMYIHKLLNEPFLYIVYTVITNNNLGELRFQPRIFNTTYFELSKKKRVYWGGHFCGNKILYDSSITYKKLDSHFAFKIVLGSFFYYKVTRFFFQKSRIQLFLKIELNSILPYKENNKKNKRKLLIWYVLFITVP